MILTYQCEIFITLEILSLISLLLFGLFRYFLEKKQMSLLFLLSFLLLLLLEGAIGFYVYKQTGEFDTFQVVILIFLLYAFTFGINDFKNLDRWMRRKIGHMRGVNLLTEKDLQIEANKKDPKKIQIKSLVWVIGHTFVFVIGQFILWSMGTDSLQDMFSYIKDLSWFESGQYEDSPYANEGMYGAGVLWIVIYAIDLIWTGSYVLFPPKKKS